MFTILELYQILIKYIKNSRTNYPADYFLTTTVMTVICGILSSAGGEIGSFINITIFRSHIHKLLSANISQHFCNNYEGVYQIKASRFTFRIFNNGSRSSGPF